jgi:ferric-dicitrate binding protein FerR (iron transport regulator)
MQTRRRGARATLGRQPRPAALLRAIAAADHAVDEMIVRSLRGTATPPEDREVQEWRRASARNEAHFQRVARVWTLTGLVDSTRLRAAPPTAAEFLDRAARRTSPATPPAARAPRGGFRRWWGAAAALVVAAAAGVAGHSLREESGVTLGAAEFVTGESQMVTAHLGDGSVVRVAPRSRLRITGVRGRRDVWLDGRAFFVVAKQPGHPFTVHTRLGEAVALGTRFDLDVTQSDLRLATLEGRVALSAAGTRVEVGGTEVVSVVAGAVSAVVRVDSMPANPDWVGDFLAFQATPLAEVARGIGRSYGVRVRIDDPQLAARTVTASFSDESLEDVLGVVCRVVAAHCAIHDRVVEMRPAFGPASPETPRPAPRTAARDLRNRN